MAICAVCAGHVPDTEIVDHLAREHGLDGWERWPDGDVVVVDETLEPQDFSP